MHILLLSFVHRENVPSNRKIFRNISLKNPKPWIWKLVRMMEINKYTPKLKKEKKITLELINLKQNATRH